MTVGNFPFGQPIKRVEQVDRNPKRVFVLGAYGSAVHARWCDRGGKELVQALAVASEPYIFWRGEDALESISKIDPPIGAGSLDPATCEFNGPSGRAIDELFLAPLGLTRRDAWFCDLVPHSCMNSKQRAALKKYRRVADKFDLPPVNWPNIPTRRINEERVKAIADELRESQAEILVTLGDKPLEWFAARFGSKKKLRFYGDQAETYGHLHSIKMAGRTLALLPLVHPHQAARIPRYVPKWANRHDSWMQDSPPRLR